MYLCVCLVVCVYVFGGVCMYVFGGVCMCLHVCGWIKQIPEKRRKTKPWINVVTQQAFQPSLPTHLSHSTPTLFPTLVDPHMRPQQAHVFLNIACVTYHLLQHKIPFVHNR